MTRWTQLALIHDPSPVPPDPPPILAPQPKVSCPLDDAKERLRKASKNLAETRPEPSNSRKKQAADPAYEAARCEFYEAWEEYLALTLDHAAALRTLAIEAGTREVLDMPEASTEPELAASRHAYLVHIGMTPSNVTVMR